MNLIRQYNGLDKKNVGKSRGIKPVEKITF